MLVQCKIRLPQFVLKATPLCHERELVASDLLQLLLQAPLQLARPLPLLLEIHLPRSFFPLLQELCLQTAPDRALLSNKVSSAFFLLLQLRHKHLVLALKDADLSSGLVQLLGEA